MAKAKEHPLKPFYSVLVLAFACSALVAAAGTELVIDLKTLPEPLQKLLTLPRFLRADVSLDEGSPETAAVQAFLIAATGGACRVGSAITVASGADPRVDP